MQCAIFVETTEYYEANSYSALCKTKEGWISVKLTSSSSKYGSNHSHRSPEGWVNLKT